MVGAGEDDSMVEWWAVVAVGRGCSRRHSVREREQRNETRKRDARAAAACSSSGFCGELRVTAALCFGASCSPAQSLRHPADGARQTPPAQQPRSNQGNSQAVIRGRASPAGSQAARHGSSPGERAITVRRRPSPPSGCGHGGGGAGLLTTYGPYCAATVASQRSWGQRPLPLPATPYAPNVPRAQQSFWKLSSIKAVHLLSRDKVGLQQTFAETGHPPSALPPSRAPTPARAVCFPDSLLNTPNFGGAPTKEKCDVFAASTKTDSSANARRAHQTIS